MEICTGITEFNGARDPPLDRGFGGSAKVKDARQRDLKARCGDKDSDSSEGFMIEIWDSPLRRRFKGNRGVCLGFVPLAWISVVVDVRSSWRADFERKRSCPVLERGVDELGVGIVWGYCLWCAVRGATVAVWALLAVKVVESVLLWLLIRAAGIRSPRLGSRVFVTVAARALRDNVQVVLVVENEVANFGFTFDDSNFSDVGESRSRGRDSRCTSTGS
ncbi:hypothetical protein Droror1_Dr00010317 [Drosera rotundifolia]